jgi:hypothetical protein
MTRLPWLALSVLLTGCPEHGSGGPRPPDGGGSLRPCGGFAGASCAAGEFCDFGRNSCGATDEQGTCRARPSGCDDLFAPVCGCDNLVHSNECDAQAAGVDVNASGSCPVPAGQFACGFRTCQTTSEYCQRGVSDVGNEPDTFTCKPLPGSCGTPNCSCVVAEPCGSFCTNGSAGGLIVTCPGG